MEVKNSEGPATIFVRSFNFTLKRKHENSSIYDFMGVIIFHQNWQRTILTGTYSVWFLVFFYSQFCIFYAKRCSVFLNHLTLLDALSYFSFNKGLATLNDILKMLTKEKSCMSGRKSCDLLTDWFLYFFYLSYTFSVLKNVLLWMDKMYFS